MPVIRVEYIDDVNELPPAFNHREDPYNEGRCLIEVDGILVGGAVLVFDEATGQPFLAECWKVSDLVAPHWASLEGMEARPVWTTGAVWTLTRDALERAGELSAYALESEERRRNGILEAVETFAKGAGIRTPAETEVTDPGPSKQDSRV